MGCLGSPAGFIGPLTSRSHPSCTSRRIQSRGHHPIQEIPSWSIQSRKPNPTNPYIPSKPTKPIPSNTPYTPIYPGRSHQARHHGLFVDCSWIDTPFCLRGSALENHFAPARSAACGKPDFFSETHPLLQKVSPFSRGRVFLEVVGPMSRQTGPTSRPTFLAGYPAGFSGRIFRPDFQPDFWPDFRQDFPVGFPAEFLAGFPGLAYMRDLGPSTSVPGTEFGAQLCPKNQKRQLLGPAGPADGPGPAGHSKNGSQKH